jgi:CheY-like chemotaxis protein
MLQGRSDLQIVGEVSDGMAAVQNAEELQPDLILLDIGLPQLNGIEAARRIRQVAPNSKILFVSEHSSSDIARGALDTGAHGYVMKSDAASELTAAVDAVLRNERFTGNRFAGHDFARASSEDFPESGSRRSSATGERPKDGIRDHEVLFYLDDEWLLDDVTQFVGRAIMAGRAAVVVATESHRKALVASLQEHGFNLDAAMEQGRYIEVDATAALSTFMLDGMPDPNRFMTLWGNLLVSAAAATNGDHGRIAIFGEGVHLLWAQGNAEAAIQIERLCNELASTYDVDILCGYSMDTQHGMDHQVFRQICAEHSAVHSLFGNG